ncbi:DUF4153 domain-containing protein [Roseovarius sp. 2305UL8-3]|uniref:DUF4153 domain-containing protein n=1 Tax=Roseovarius conchicola TaxID=3121636 RepID=UPI003529BB35
MKIFLVKGVPASIQRDSWWMDGPIHRRPTPPKGGTAKPGRWDRPALLVALILLADLLLWGTAPGLSLALFGLCLLLAAFVLTRGRGWGGLILGEAMFLPLIEQVQTLSLLFWAAGLLLGGTWIALGGWPGLRAAALGAIRFLALGPLQSLYDLRAGLALRAPERPIAEKIGSLTLGWALPVGLGLIFLSLLFEANPVVQSWAAQLETVRTPTLSRVCFWFGMALLIWPFLRLAVLRQRLTISAPAPLIGPRWRPGILNPDAVRRSLILFNLLFLAQTTMDATYLLGGAALPEGMSYAQYAHRGAYPLLLTALLAGAFALIARPFTDVDRTLRMALLFWIAQTILLVLSSLLRLDLYVEAYGLTRLRMAAGIWMGVVATGLVLTLWQIAAKQGTSWWLKRCAMLGAVTLYTCMFFSFDRQIARYNLTHGFTEDAHYICTLGPAALPEIRRHAPDLCDYYRGPYAPFVTDWREWGFRDWRVLRSLAALNTQAADI